MPSSLRVDFGASVLSDSDSDSATGAATNKVQPSKVRADGLEARIGGEIEAHVEDFGGFEEVENQDNWAEISREIGMEEVLARVARSIYLRRTGAHIWSDTAESDNGYLSALLVSKKRNGDMPTPAIDSESRRRVTFSSLHNHFSFLGHGRVSGPFGDFC